MPTTPLWLDIKKRSIPGVKRTKHAVSITSLGNWGVMNV